MSLGPGTRLGPYEILSAIGAGGMGEVYKAKDTRLDRTVAVKVLPEHVAADPELRQRFEREAKTLATLSHAHICPVFDVGSQNGIDFLVMEYLEGETLERRLKKGALPLDQALQIGIQIADALSAAHRAGVIHRDLKPGNIMLTRSGAKLLDFGLARLCAAAPVSMSGMTHLATAAPRTASGTILGTLHYMAPEQIEGGDADARSDIWMLGAVLYEMVVAERPFEGASPASVIGAILKDHPLPLSSRQPLSPRTLDQVVERCLAKDPDERWQHIADVKYQLAAIASTSADRASHALAAPSATASGWKVVAGALVVIAAVVAFLTWSGATRPAVTAAGAAVRVALDLPDMATATDLPVFALSPDGTRIVFVSRGPDGVSRLSTRRLDQPDAAMLVGTEGAYTPFFSPDGQSVGFFADGKLKKTRLDGGEPVILCDAPAGRGANWGDDGKIIAALDNRAPLSLVRADGGVVVPVTTLGPGEISHRWPQFLPRSNFVVFTVSSVPANYETASVAVASLVNNPERIKKIVLGNAGMSPRYVPTGLLTYVTKGTLYAVNFDLDRLEVRGPAAPVLEDLSADIPFGSAQLDLSQTGAALYRSGRMEGLRVIQWLHSDGKTESLWGEPAFYQFPTVSPDGSRLVVTRTDGSNSVIWAYDWQRGSRIRLTAGPGVYTNPIWSPDGRYVIFQSAGGMFWTRADGAEQPQPLTKSANLQFPTSFTPDGKRLLFYETAPRGGSLIQTMPMEHNSGGLQAGQPELFRQLPSANSVGAFSPDGRWIAYTSAESGVYEVYVRAFPDSGKQWLISTGGGAFPIWSRVRNELFYRTEDHHIMMSTYTVMGDSFLAGKPKLWSETQIFNIGLTNNFDLAPDGRQFAVLMSSDGPESRTSQRHVTLVLNFFDEAVRRLTAAVP
jgi:Tol biopolymer transport system component/predicted Ser/Thr protein kinase